ncbi:MAG: multifunctional oxoglutarate decarboxylase/oxoglutarate dehydrogenase thiamine pyrophosphate-binding subunit/dihydrolipoyllysine-residue succinyltransferase subunit, partial [Planctomycetes bacterium]|nr:multifunctional oxoglutarate decarboxylase/oxoglutarate dehydrogenase thiamine pyrophosphate-binding subunit/dihydrolipoyllysine-residue succinyltransferase subunit [Planctomycetota bacterium]
MHAPDFEEVFGVNAAYAEKVYGEYLSSPESVPAEWRHWFETSLPPELRAQIVAPAAPAGEAHDGAATNGAVAAAAGAALEPLRGVAARIVQNMTESVAVPTATSTREVPVKVLEENRHTINRHQLGQYLPKVSFTHLIGWAIVRAIARVPAMTGVFVEQDGKPFRRVDGSLQLGIAVDLAPKGDDPNARRSLVVPNVRDAGALDFAGFFAAFNAQIDKARRGKLTPDDFAGTTCTLTNPGTIGTMSSLPRLMSGQSFILATGAITVPGAFQGAAQETLTELGVARVMTLTSTYDHRVIQGAESGLFLDWMYRLLLGEEGFYDEVYRALKVPYRPVRNARDRRAPLGSSLRETESLERAAGLMTYIRSYRVRGHVLAALDPLGDGLADEAVADWPELDMSTYGLTIWDKDRTFYSDGVTKAPFATLREIQETLHLTYCRHVGAEFMHIADQEQRHWLRERMEQNRNEEPLGKEIQLRILDQLVEAEAFEQFLHTRFVGHKRFSLEGGDTLMPTLHALLDAAAERGVERAVLGMAHRGRLNVLAHVMQKSLTRIFSEFEGSIDPQTTQGSGDVKYHLGATGTFRASNGQEILLELASNPSHLEAVDPVVEGMARARQEMLDDDEPRTNVLPVLVHGDAAFAGQGVVNETLNMSQLHGYRTGGTVHVIVNNQIGYTTNPVDARSTLFCSDVAKGFQVPVFHVNGDDALAAVRMIRLALDYRQRFERDVVLDIVCYRRHGHNEGDEPSFTQPLLYRKIEAHPSVREIYQDYLVRAGVLESEDAAQFTDALDERLRASLSEVRESKPHEPAAVDLEPTPEREWDVAIERIDAAAVEELGLALASWPDTFVPHPKIVRLFERRRAMVHDEHPFDFATAEALAFASLLARGRPIRLAGQDSGRGTFSQRHSVLIDSTTGEKHIPLNFVHQDQAKYVVVDSFLSEEAALGFEYGYSIARPESFTMWEAQFGDFCNGAQIQIDQFVAAGEAKWNQRSSLTLLLPHGFDGQGPEHSSARLERFLQLWAENNMRVANVTTAAQYCHLLRRQALDPERKPLIVMTPKSLLRQRSAGSSVADIVERDFAPVLVDPVGDVSKVTK